MAVALSSLTAEVLADVVEGKFIQLVYSEASCRTSMSAGSAEPHPTRQQRAVSGRKLDSLRYQRNQE